MSGVGGPDALREDGGTLPGPDLPPGTAWGEEAAGADPTVAEGVLAHIESLPTLSPIATRLLKLSDAEDAETEEIVSLIEADPSLSARMLSLCRRASVGAGVVSTVKRAVVLLGLEAVQAAVLSVQIYEVLSQAPNGLESRDGQAAAFDRAGFWRHCVAVACAAELLAESHREKHIRPEEAFTAGLVHDLGKLALDWILPMSYARVLTAAEERGVDLAGVERTVLGLDHHLAGKRLAEHWRLPHVLRDAMWLHGQRMSALPELRHKDVVGLVTAADGLCRRLHLGWSGNAASAPTMEALCADAELDPVRVADVEPQLHEALARRCKDLGLEDQTSPELVVQSIASANARLTRLQDRWRTRAKASAGQGRILKAITAFSESMRPGLGVAQTAGLIARSHQHLSGRTPVALVYQTRAEDQWRVVDLTAAADGAATAEIASAHEPPKDQRGRPMSIRDACGPEADLGETVILLTWLAEHVTAAPDLRETGVVALLSPLGPAAALLHGPAKEKLSRRALSASEMAPVVTVWASALGGACQFEGNRRLTEALADMTRALGRTQQQLAAAESMARLGELTAGAAHELNNPLTVISGRAQLLAEHLTEKRLRAEAQSIVTAAGKMTELVTRLHTIAKPPRPIAQMLPLAELLNEAAATARRRVASQRSGLAGKPVRVTVQSPLDRVCLDRTQTVAAVVELIANALECSPRTGVDVRACLDARASTLVLRVTDDGSGMSPHALQHAFDPFFSEKTAGRQAGLGLALARRLIVNQQGGIKLDSVPGKGTSVTVVFTRWRGESLGADTRAA